MINFSFAVALIYSLVSGKSVVLAEMSDFVLRPEVLIESINAFAKEFRANLRVALWREIFFGRMFTNHVDIQICVGATSFPCIAKSAYDAKTDPDAFINDIVDKLSEEVRKELALHIICTHEFRNQRGAI